MLLVNCNLKPNRTATTSQEYETICNLIVTNIDSAEKLLGKTELKLVSKLSSAEYTVVKGLLANAKGNYKLASSILLPLSTKITNAKLPSELQADFHNQLGIAYSNTENVHEAVLEYQKLLAIAEKLNDQSKIAAALNNIAIEFTYSDNFDESEKYLQKSLAVASKAALHTQVNDAYTNLSYLWEKKGNSLKALEFLYPVLVSEKESNNPQLLISTYDQMGILHTNLNNTDSAQYYLLLAKNIVDSSKNKAHFFWVYHSLANFYTQNNNQAQALFYADTVLKESFIESDERARVDIYKIYTAIYQNAGNFSKALQYSQATIALNDTLATVIKEDDVLALQKNFELAQLDKSLALERRNLYWNQVIAAILTVALLASLIVILTYLRLAKKRKQLIKAIELEQLRTEEALQENKQLVAFIAHEIRNPLTGIIGISKMLIQENPTAEQKEFLQYQLNAGNGLLQLLAQLLDYQKVSAGKQELHLLSCSLKEVLKQVYEMYASIIAEKKISYQLLFDSSIPDTLQADPVKLTQIFGNLVNNAIKFCNKQKGEIVTTITLIHSNSTSSTLLCSVRDNGAGISEADKDRIFELYVQSSKNKSQQLGTGIGLSLVKHYLELMKSKIEIESTEGKGTTFSFTITLAK